MKIGVTGSGGLLGSAFFDLGAFRKTSFVPIPYQGLHLGGSGKNLDLLREYQVDHVIHCAADTNVERNEVEPVSAFRSNTMLSEALANACRELGIGLTFISSTGVYGSHSDEPYTEFSEVAPTTVHHRSKFLAEQAVQRHVPNALIIRTGWIFGGLLSNGKNFVANRIREMKRASGHVHGNAGQFGCPTFASDVAVRVVKSIEHGLFGVYNCVNEGSASRLEYLAEIASQAGLEVEVNAVDASFFKRIAPVSHNEMALNYKYSIIGFEDMPSWKDSLGRYISTLDRSKI